MIIGKQFHFDAAHYLPGHPTCGKVHGHTWTVDIELEGPLNDQSMVFDFGKLKEIMNHILKDFDHCNLNDFINYPTCEVIASHLGTISKNYLQWKEVRLHSVKVQEGTGGYAIYKP